MRKLYIRSLLSMALSFSLVTAWPYVWLLTDNFSGLEMSMLIAVVLAWLLALLMPVVYSKRLKQAQGLEQAHIRFLLSSYVKHIVIGVVLLIVSLMIFYVSDQLYILIFTDPLFVYGITACLITSAYMVVLDWILLDSVLRSYAAFHRQEQPHDVISALRILRKPFWIVLPVMILIHFVLMGWGAILLSILIPAVILSKWLVTLVKVHRFEHLPTEFIGRDTESNTEQPQTE